MQCSLWPADAVSLGNQASAGSASLGLRMVLCSAEQGELQQRLCLAQKIVSALYFLLEVNHSVLLQ